MRPVQTEYTALIGATAQQYGLRADVLEAQVLVESSGHTDAFRFETDIWQQILTGKLQLPSAWKGQPARRVASSYGLLQILFVTAVDIGYEDEPEMLFLPAVGLQWGARYFASLLEWAKGDYVRALAAYNGGRGAAMKAPYRTQAYADKVLAQV